MKKLKKLSPILALCVVWVLIFVLNICKPYKSFSENENKVFSKFPAFSIKNVLSGDYTSSINTYLNEQFIFRDMWINLRTDAEILFGKKEINGVFICDDALISRIGEPDEDNIDGNISAVNDFAKFYSDKNVNVMIVPSASEIQNSKLPYGVHLWNQTKVINDIYSRTDKTENIDVSSSLLKEKDEYIFYRTDHHWTTYGAYLGYFAYCTSNNIVPSVYKAKEVSDSFLGTLYSKSGYSHIEKDRIDAYTVDFETELEIPDEGKKNSVFYDEYLDKKDKYSYFLGTNKPLITVYGKNDSQKQLLIFKDSYAHCLTPMLLENYRKITLVDLRYLKYKLNEKIDIKKYDDILFIYGIETFVTTNDISKLPYFANVELQEYGTSQETE